MATAATVLAVYSARGRRGLPRAGVYRQVFRRELSRRAYGRIYRKAGALPPGGPGETVDAMSLATVAKKNGQRRPLGLPTGADKLVQEARRLLREAYYEPQFSAFSHSFRQGRGCHPARQEIPRRWRGVTWFSEGDIKGCYDHMDQQVLWSMLADDIHDKRFLRLIANLLKAGYLETGRYQATLSGPPPGSLASPIRANVSLNRVARFGEQTRLPTFNRGDQGRTNPAYQALLNAARKAGD